MRIESTRVAAGPQLRHAAAFHRSPSDLLTQLTAVARAGIARGEPIAVALRPETETALAAALGSGAALVRLPLPEGPDSVSGQTLATRRARELRALTTASGPVTVVTEHWSRFDGADGLFWSELDAATSIALAAMPVRLTCFFPDLPLHQSVTDGARRNHPALLVSGLSRANPDHLPPHDVLAAMPAPAPAVLRPPDLRRTFGAWALNEVRAAVEAELIGAGFGIERAEDVVLAVNEIATNAVEHGTAESEIAVWIEPDGLVVEIHDGGRLGDPLPGLAAPHPAEARGRGVWIARQLTDSLHVWTDRAGTHVRLRAAP